MRHTPALALGLVLAAGTAASAQAEPWPARLFMLHHAEQPLVRDVAETSMGRVVVATGDYPAQVADIRLLTSRGRLRALSRHGDADPIDGGSGIGIGGDGAGRVLVMEGMNAQLMRTALSGASTLLAGTGVPGFSGDGGPGVLAQLDPRGALAGGVTQLGDGSVVFTDAGNNRLRRIRADGTIETYAGSGPGVSANTIGCGPVGDGGPAAEATLCRPSDVVATPDGTVVSDAFHNRIRLIAPNGTIRTIAGNGGTGHAPSDAGRPATRVAVPFPGAVAAMPDGGVVYAEIGQVARITPGGRWVPLLRFRPDTAMTEITGTPMHDFAGREVLTPPSGLAATREGGLLVAAGDLYYLAPAHTTRTLVAIRDARSGHDRLAVDVEATRGGSATLDIGRRSVSRKVRAGRHRFLLTGRLGQGPTRVAVHVRGPRRAGHDALWLYLGGRLALSDARSFASLLNGADPLRCRRLAATRVDCTIPSDEYGEIGLCVGATAFRLRASGVVWHRSYGCDDAFERHPRWNGPAEPWLLEPPAGQSRRSSQAR